MPAGSSTCRRMCSRNGSPAAVSTTRPRTACGLEHMSPYVLAERFPGGGLDDPSQDEVAHVRVRRTTARFAPWPGDGSVQPREQLGVALGGVGWPDPPDRQRVRDPGCVVE